MSLKDKVDLHVNEFMGDCEKSDRVGEGDCCAIRSNSEFKSRQSP